MGVAPSGKNQSVARVTGQVIIDQLIRNMELGLFEMGYSALAPCIFSVYLHPDEYVRLADAEADVPTGDVEIHSELNEVPQPGYRGTKTTLIDRETSITAARVARDRTLTRRSPEKIFAEIRYEDDSGPQIYYVTQNEVTIGRGGGDLSVDLPPYTNDEVSREHLRLRRDPETGRFGITDQSRNGTWLNGRRLERGVEAQVPERAQILVAEVIALSLELKS